MITSIKADTTPPNILNGIESNHKNGNATSARSAIGHEMANNMHQRKNVKINLMITATDKKDIGCQFDLSSDQIQ